jgi:hypothetical protein
MLELIRNKWHAMKYCDITCSMIWQSMSAVDYLITFSNGFIWLYNCLFLYWLNDLIKVLIYLWIIYCVCAVCAVSSPMSSGSPGDMKVPQVIQSCPPCISMIQQPLFDMLRCLFGRYVRMWDCTLVQCVHVQASRVNVCIDRLIHS